MSQPPDRRPSGQVLEEVLAALLRVEELLRAQRERDRETKHMWQRIIVAMGIIADRQADDD